MAKINIDVRGEGSWEKHFEIADGEYLMLTLTPGDGQTDLSITQPHLEILLPEIPDEVLEKIGQWLIDYAQRS